MILYASLGGHDFGPASSMLAHHQTITALLSRTCTLKRGGAIDLSGCKGCRASWSVTLLLTQTCAGLLAGAENGLLVSFR